MPEIEVRVVKWHDIIGGAWQEVLLQSCIGSYIESLPYAVPTYLHRVRIPLPSYWIYKSVPPLMRILEFEKVRAINWEDGVCGSPHTIFRRIH